MRQIIRKIFLGVAVAVSAVLVGCAGPAPNYAPSIDNVEVLKKSGAAPLKTGSLAVKEGLPGGVSLSVRANQMVSPVGKNFGDYIMAALQQELELAKLHDPRSGVVISGELLENNIDAGGFSTAEGQIKVRFVVKANDQVKYDKVKRIVHKWESSFVGAVAIPKAINSYPEMVQMVIRDLLRDPDFVAAVRK